MILAAGVGSRLDPLTKSMPKPLVPILGRPVMEYIINLCKKHGFTNLSANIHMMANMMLEHFRNAGKNFDVTLNMVHEKDLTGVAGGIRSCKKFLTQDAVLIIMGDALTDADLSSLYEKHIESNCAVTIGITEVGDTSQFGVVVTDKNNHVISFQEKPKPEEAKSNLANTGIYFFNQRVLSEMPPEKDMPIYDVAKDLFPELMSKKIPMQAIKIKGYWADIGTLKQYKRSIKDVLDGRVFISPTAEKTKYGFKEKNAKIDPLIKILGKAYLGSNIKIGKNVTLSGYCCIEEGCVIEDDCYIDNSVIWAGTRISTGTKVINSIIGDNCNVTKGVDVLSNSVWAPKSHIKAGSTPSIVFK